jgi:hypothetical protein
LSEGAAGVAPRGKVSMMIMRPPQQSGHEPRIVSIFSDAIDPKRTSRGLKSRSAAVEVWYHPSIA